MGFKCPVCKKDFENNKTEFDKHLSEENYSYDFQTLTNINVNETLIGILKNTNKNITDVNKELLNV